MTKILDDLLYEPLVSVILPVYNCEIFINESLSSIIEQTHKNLEVIVIDDCSTDLTGEALAKYSNFDSRIKVFRNCMNKGVIFSRNKALSEASGRFVAFIDADDIWHPQKIEIQIRNMLRLGCSLSFTNYRQINQSGEKTGLLLRGPKRIGWHLHHLSRFIALSTVIIDLKQTEQVQFDERNELNFAEDFLLWGKLMVDYGRAVRIDFDLTRLRLHTMSLSSNKFKSAQKIWIIQRQIEGLSISQSTAYFICYTFFSIFKKIIYAPYFHRSLGAFKKYL